MELKNKPRSPSESELIDLWEFLSNEMAGDDEEAGAIIERSYIAVFDDYMTDGPGYVGKVLVVVWPGDPSFHECYVWRGGLIERQLIDLGFARTEGR